MINLIIRARKHKLKNTTGMTKEDRIERRTLIRKS